MNKTVFFGTLTAAGIVAGMASAATLDDVKARGELNCGVSTGLAPRRDGRRAVPSFQLPVEQYTDDRHAPSAMARETGIPAATIERVAAELARVAFDESIELPIAWTDRAGHRHRSVV